MDAPTRPYRPGLEVRASEFTILDTTRTIPTIVTYLATESRPSAHAPPRPLLKTAIMRCHDVPIHFYRYLYNTIGEPYLWLERRRWTDEKLAELIADPSVMLYVLYIEGVPAGMSELDFRVDGIGQIAFFGLMPEFTGRRIGPWFLHQTLEVAWAEPINEVQVETCTLDHRKALSTYQRAGFEPYARSEKTISVPEGISLPPHMA